MKVKTTSWHYRFNVWRSSTWKTQRKNSLCSYFWFTVIGLVYCSAIAAAVLIFFFGLGFAINDELIKHGLSVLNLPFYAGYPVMFLMGIVGVAIIAGVIFGVFGAIIYGKKSAVHLIYSYNTRTQPNGERKEDGLLVSWLKAKKSKVCPVIEFDEGE